MDGEERLLVLHLRVARCRANEAAAAEALGLLRGLNPRVEAGGPLAERGGLLRIAVAAALGEARR